jgi:hypothetical protein
MTRHLEGSARFLFTAVVTVGSACADSPTTIWIDDHESGSYRFQAGDIVDERPQMLLEDPTISPQCCLFVQRWGDMLQLSVGNWVPNPPLQDCPPVATALIQVPRIVDGAQTIDVATQARGYFYRDDAATGPCSVFADPYTLSHDDQVIWSGQIKLDADFCVDGDDVTCALVASGTFSIEGTRRTTGEVVATANGTFDRQDTRSAY